MEKPIKGYKDYTVDEQGNVYSYKWNRKHIITPWVDSRGLYVMVTLQKEDKSGKRNLLVHRLVAEAFIPNPENKKEVDHIDKNPQNNNVNNLRWCDRQFNLQQSYSTLSPVRNYKITELIINDQHIGYFQSTKLACRYAAKLGYSATSLEKYRKCKDAVIIQQDVTTIENGGEVKIITSLTEVE